MPKKRGKKYIEAAKKVEAAVSQNGDGGLEPEVACQIVRDTSISKFDATVEAHIRLGVDPRHAEQMVRGSVVLPNGTGKKVRVAVFAAGDRAREAQEAGADVVGGDDLVKRVSEGWTDFDSAIATPDMMAKVGIIHVPIGKVSFDSKQLHENLSTLVDALIRNKPSTSKGQYLRTFFLTSTQGPSVPVDVKEAAKL